MNIFKNDWDEVLENEFNKDYFRELSDFVQMERIKFTVYPPEDQVFTAFQRTPYSKVKVAILGQDPYHEEGQAHGLAFSVLKGTKVPPSLVNIYKEIETDLGFKRKAQGNLIKWADEGVLLINACLTVRAQEANSHKGKGWEKFTDRVIELLNEKEEPVVFILWGGNARSKVKLITNKNHLILEGAHPSPLSAYRGFFGGRYFSKTNEFLAEKGRDPIDWEIKEEI